MTHVSSSHAPIHPSRFTFPHHVPCQIPHTSPISIPHDSHLKPTNVLNGSQSYSENQLATPVLFLPDEAQSLTVNLADCTVCIAGHRHLHPEICRTELLLMESVVAST
jgi:hypothetical protein